MSQVFERFRSEVEPGLIAALLDHLNREGADFSSGCKAERRIHPQQGL